MPTRLRVPLFGEAPAVPAPRGPVIGAKGFRVFFLLAGVFAALMVPLWLLALAGGFDPGAYLGPVYWHAHEMVFGYAAAVIAGFLLTAVGNWTGRETAVGPPLLGLGALWLLGRVAMLSAHVLPPWLAAVAELAFLPALGVTLARPLIATKNTRNFIMLAVIAALWCADLAVHLDALGLVSGWRRRGNLLGVDVVTFVILVLAGRVFPMFTRNATGVASIRSVPSLDVAALASMALVIALDAALPDARPTALVAGVAAVLAAARAAHWGSRHTGSNPLLWILHVGYAWVPVGLALRVVAAFTARVPPSAATHALTVGAIGGLTLGMMSRVALGHTGRMLTVTRPVAASFALVSLSALVRVAVGIVNPSWYRASLYAAGALWTAAFAIFVAAYAPVVSTPRVDGKPG